VPQNASYSDFARYAEDCLRIAHQLEERRMRREMAAEWKRLGVYNSAPVKSSEIRRIKSEQNSKPTMKNPGQR
jgi:hypothetical protein